MDYASALQAQFGLQAWQANNIIQLIDEGNTIPFIARYRKEAHGSMKYSTPMQINQRISAWIFRKTMCCRVRSSHRCLIPATSTVMIRFQRPFFQSVN